MAYNAPHWPLHAKDKDLEKFAGKYDKGWEAVREERYRKMVELGIVNPDWKLAEWESRAWNELTEAERDSSSLRMSVYAAQVYCMDYNIGKLIDYLEEEGKLDNTLILFLSDNGACAEPYSEKGFEAQVRLISLTAGFILLMDCLGHRLAIHRTGNIKYGPMKEALLPIDYFLAGSAWKV